MVKQWNAIEIDIDGRTFRVSPVGSCALENGNVVADALTVSMTNPLFSTHDNLLVQPRLKLPCLKNGLTSKRNLETNI